MPGYSDTRQTAFLAPHFSLFHEEVATSHWVLGCFGNILIYVHPSFYDLIHSIDECRNRIR